MTGKFINSLDHSRTLVVIRHAHRNKTSDPETDNGLSKKGKQQAKRIQKYIIRAFAKTKPLILSSPKKRCIETVQPLAKAYRLSVESSDLLDEARNLQCNVDTFLLAWKKNNSNLTFICSHGDWIQVFLKKVLSTDVALDKGGWAELVLNHGKLSLRALIQDPER